ncbi:hypothetical protein UNDYM_5669 [Undibacterium sp. YM2]|jgi:hypothetical protein|uniref:hypothetical protein n=1 Tax=Undibacterium sp. YM2 TaxID=2058625 RepID=UPI001331FC51|nr:hypothetical protein [Undibacterium sp. YM2]BBB69922.1 hypothetical protein UNDYM_5669 [Undibacterium sp. YM2]
MSDAQAEYDKLTKKLTAIASAEPGQMFGKACLKINGKAFVALHKETVVFKLTGDEHAKAIALADAVLWDPSGKGRPMKEWVALTATHGKKFPTLAQAALEYVQSQT